MLYSSCIDTCVLSPLKTKSCSYISIHYRLYQNRLRDKGVVDMLPGLYGAKALKQLRYYSCNQCNSVPVVSVHV